MMLMFGLLALNYLSWCLLGLGVAKHYRQHFGREPPGGRQRLLKTAGWATAVLALALAWWRGGWDLGAVAWAGSWMAAAMVWVLLQPYRPRLARRLAPALLVLAVLLPLLV